MIVLDASATVELLLGTSVGSAVAERVDTGETWHAPHLLDVEVAQVIRRLALKGQVEEARAAGALLDLVDLDVTRYPHDVLLARVWQLRSSLSAYDAVYVALAETLDAALLTTDARLARTTTHDARIELVTARDT